MQSHHDPYRRILNTLKARDPQASRAAMRSHLDLVINVLLSTTEADALQRARSQLPQSGKRWRRDDLREDDEVRAHDSLSSTWNCVPIRGRPAGTQSRAALRGTNPA
jgi:hypothetical protein